MSLSSGTRLGQYEVRELIGQGGMGEVYRAHDTKLKRDVAIKLLPEQFALDPERLARFKREAQLLASLNHPNIATIYGLEEANGSHFLVMELVPGETLEERVRKQGAVPLEESLDIAKQICEALEHAHEKNIIHRDLKPANVKLTPEGKVKVLDFGLAKAFGADGAGSGAPVPVPLPVIDANSPTLSRLPEGYKRQDFSPTLPGVILGTAAYMSPEQARGKTVDKRTDIWALGLRIV
jgi:eukaryotic-like serine/threonine-protein kinase